MARRETFAALVERLTPGETWQDFAERAGVSTRRLQTFRTEGSKRPHRTTVEAIARALGVAPSVVAAAIAASRAAAETD